jgi:ATP-dependent helicase HepA
VDPPDCSTFEVEALNHQFQRRKSIQLVGGRIDLIPHQLYIAAEVSSGCRRTQLAMKSAAKAIEACLIHRLILTGHSRALILVPESLVHQWFVELLRRFNLWFHIFDEERCMEIEASNSGTNPFSDSQYVLSTIGLFTDSKRRLQQAIDAGWDILVVDEAHHLGWTRSTVSPEYAVVESLANVQLLLLTGTRNSWVSAALRPVAAAGSQSFRSGRIQGNRAYRKVARRGQNF